MKTLGVDLAASPKKTALAVIEWREGSARIVHLALGASDQDIVDQFAETDVTGIDSPLGWPTAFLSFLQGHSQADPDAVLRHDGLEGRRELAYRATDRFVTKTTAMIPLSVSADRLAHPAMRCAVIQAKIAQLYGVQAKDGSGRLFEVYPAASLKLWGIIARGYKGRGTDESDLRARIVDGVAAAAPWLDLSAHRGELCSSDDLLDAVVASLTARAVARGATLWPGREQQSSALEEGWIHLPSGSLAELVAA